MDSVLCALIMGLGPCSLHLYHGEMGWGANQVPGLNYLQIGSVVQPAFDIKGPGRTGADHTRIMFQAAIKWPLPSQWPDRSGSKDLTLGGSYSAPASYYGWTALKMGPKAFHGPAIWIEWIPIMSRKVARDEQGSRVPKMGSIQACGWQSSWISSWKRNSSWAFGRYFGPAFNKEPLNLVHPWFFYASAQAPIRDYLGYGLGIGYQKMGPQQELTGLNGELSLWTGDHRRLLKVKLDLSGYYPLLEYSLRWSTRFFTRFSWKYHPDLGHVVHVRCGLGGISKK